MDNKKLYILTYDHGGYVLWKDHVKPRLKKMFTWLEKYPSLKIGLDYESFTFDEFSKEDPEIVELVGELLKKYPDRVGLGATTYGQPLALTISEESNARQLIYAVRTNLKYYGVTPSVYAISEFALHNQTPQLISQCGYEGAIMRSHVMGYGYTKNFDSPWGQWVGKDGTRVPCVPTYPKQGRGFNCTTVDNWILSRWPDDSDLYSLEDFRDMFSKYEPLLASRYDDLTQPVDKIIEHTEGKKNFEYVLLEDLPRIYGEAKEELVTTDNDFHVQMPWGYCGNEIFNGCRKGEVDAVQGEKLNALSVMLGGSSLQSLSEEAWKYILAAEHHDVTICGLLDLSRRFIPQSLSASAQVTEQSLRSIASRFASTAGDSIIVINTHSFPVEQWVEVKIPHPVCAYDGETKAMCFTEEKDGAFTLMLLARVEPFSVKKYILKNAVSENTSQFLWDEKTGTLTTPQYTAILNNNGIVSLSVNKTGRQIINNPDGALFSGYIEGSQQFSRGKWDVAVNEFSAAASFKGCIGSIPFTFRMSFNKNQNSIDCKCGFDISGEHVGRTDVTHGKPATLTVNGHHHEDKLCFVASLFLDENRKMYRDLPYALSEWNGALRKTEEYWYPDDRIIYDVEVSPRESFENTTYYHGIYSVSLRDGKQGLALLNKGCMGCAVEGNRVYLPLIYSNPYLCGDRILDGYFENEFSILPFESTLSQADLHKQAMAYAYPLTASFVPKGNGELDAFTAFDFDSNNSDVILTALYPEENHLLARLCNFGDSECNVTLRPAVGNIVAQTDLLGNETDAVSDNTLSFRPWEIKTIKIAL